MNTLQQLIDFFTSLPQSPVSLPKAIFALAFSIIASAITLLMYHIFYGSKHLGAGVNRTFLIGGPAVTMLFLGIQSSIPLSLGLLGALSFVRFRTPVKDPAEIGYLLLLIAASIGSATNNFVLVILLFAMVFVVLGIQWLVGNNFSLLRQGQLMISVDNASFPGLETKLSEFLKDQLNGISLETMSVLADRVSLHYQYRQSSGFDSAAFIADLNKLAGPAKIEVFIG
jgi:hypothetical protein